MLYNRKTLFCLLFWAGTFSLSAQTVSYEDVGVIVNTTDSASVAIADYFMTSRSIPSTNRIEIQVPSKEEISQEEFDSLRAQVERVLAKNGLFDQLNYLVTTKGVPLKIKRNDPDTKGCNASVESELMLLHPLNNVYIGLCSSGSQLVNGDYFGNPYYQAEIPFSSRIFGMYLVTRLDAYSVQEVKRILDSSGPFTYASKESAWFVFDQAVNFNNDMLNLAFEQTSNLLRERGWQVHLNTDSVFVTGLDSVLGYASWGSNDASAELFSLHAKPGFTWLPGAIAETHVSTSGRSFTSGTLYGQSLIADLIAEGVSGVKGYVYEPYTMAIAISSILFERYTRMDSSGKPMFNLAESYFAASRLIGWMDVVIGDPKTSLSTNRQLGINSQKQQQAGFQICPNPAQNEIRIHAPDWKQRENIRIWDLGGQIIYQQNLYPDSATIDVSYWESGVYFIAVGQSVQKIILLSNQH